MKNTKIGIEIVVVSFVLGCILTWIFSSKTFPSSAQIYRATLAVSIGIGLGSSIQTSIRKQAGIGMGAVGAILGTIGGFLGHSVLLWILYHS